MTSFFLIKPIKFYVFKLNLSFSKNVLESTLIIQITNNNQLLTKMDAMATGMPITPLKLIKFNEKMQTVSNNVCMF